MKIDIIVFTCDKYSSLWSYFYSFFNNNFPTELVNKFYFITDKKPSRTYGIEESLFLANNSNNFFERIESFLLNSKADYFLLLLDDYFLAETIDKNLFESLLLFCSQSSADYLKLTITHKNTFNKRIFENHNNIHLLKTTKEYSVDLYPSIWKKEFVLKIKNEWKFEENTIWDFEGKIHKINNSNRCFVYTGKKIKFIDVIRKGKLRREAHKILLSKFDYDLTSQWPLMSRNECFNDKVVPFLSMYSPRFIKNAFKAIGKKKGRKYYSD